MKPPAASKAAFLAIALLCPCIAEAQSIVELHKAVGRKEITACAKGNGGYSTVNLMLKNLTDRALLVDTAGSYLVPGSGGYQRLGLGTPVVSKSDPAARLIPLSPRGEWKGDVNSCCMDQGLSSPASGLPYSARSEPAPDRVFKALRVWAACPKLNQSDVNAVVWGNAKLKVLEDKAREVGVTYMPDPNKTRLKADGGKVFWLALDGVLHSKPSDRMDGWSVLAPQVSDFDAGWGEVITYRTDLEVVLRYNATERKWEEWTLPHKPRSMVVAPGMSFYSLSMDGGLYVKRQGSDCFNSIGFGVKSLALSHSAVNPFVYAARDGAGCIDWARGDDPWRSMPFRSVDRIGATASSLFAEDQAGVYRWSGRWTRIAGPGWSLIAGESVCYLRKGGSFRVVRDRSAASTACPAPGGEVAHCAVDRTTDELFCVLAKGEIEKLSGGKWLMLGSVPAQSGK